MVCFDVPFYGVEGVLIRLLQSKTFIMCVYVPPNVHAGMLQSLIAHINTRLDDLSVQFPNHQFVIAGDLNKLDVNEICVYHNFKDIVTRPTRKDHILDHLLMSSELNELYRTDEVMYDCPLGNSDHRVITACPISPQDALKESQHCVRYVYDFRKSNIDFLLSMASNVDWERVVEADDVDDKWNNFETCLQALLNICIPMKEVHMTDRDKQWLTPLIKMLINDRWQAYRMKNWAVYNHLKSKVKIEIAKAKRSWAKKLQSATYGIWNLAKHVTSKSRKVDFSSLISKFGSTDALAAALADHFEKIASSQVMKDGSSSHRIGRMQLSLKTPLYLNVSEREVKELLEKAPLNKAPGNDCIPNALYVSLTDFIARPLALIYEASFSQSKFPTGWKKGVVVPIPKKRLPNVSDVRPITLNPFPSKICEKIIRRHFISLFEDNYGSDQHGFRRGASTTTALIKIIDTCLENYDDESSSGYALLSLDLSKAFDCLDHDLILTKMMEKRFPVGLIAWTQDYLRGRSAKVKLGCKFSRSFPIQRGVPQGTVLGPLVFNLFVSDFSPTLPSSTIVKYADDMNIVVRINSKNTNEIKSMVEKEICNATMWCNQNGLVINAKKSSVLLNLRNPGNCPDSFSFPKKEHIKVLGVRLSNNLSWSGHIEDVFRKANQRFHVLKQIKPLVTPQDLHQVYIAFIRSILDYCSPVFVKLPNCQAKRLESIDKRAHRIIFHDRERTCSCGSIRNRRELMSLRLLQNIESTDDHIIKHLLPHRLHYSNKFSSIYSRTCKRHQSFIPYITRLHNDM